MEKYYDRFEKLLDNVIGSNKLEYSEKEELLKGFIEAIADKQFLMRMAE